MLAKKLSLRGVSLKISALACLFPALLAGFFIFTNIAHAQDIIISEDTIWTEGGPVVIDGAEGLVVSSGTTLTLEAGVIIKLAENNNITIQGNLNINGTAENPVIVTSLKDDQAGGDTNNDGNTTSPAPMDWGALLIAGPNSNINIDYANIKYAGGYSIGFNLYLGVIEANTINISHSNIINNYGLARIDTVNNIAITNSNIHNPDFCEAGFCGSTILNTGETQIQAINNYWGHAEGPTIDPEAIKGTFLSGDIIYEPFLTEEWLPEPPAPERNPVIIVPGILGSELTKSGILDNEIWPDPLNYIRNFEDEQLLELKMNSDGQSEEEIFASGIITDVLGVDFYGGLIEYLEENGYEENVNLFVFPYDWRLDLDIIADLLKDEIDTILLNPEFDKVDIVAHSMGGLVVKNYVAKYNNEGARDNIGKFIDIATPHFGSPKSAKILNYGDDLNFNFFVFSLNQGRVKEISQNMPSIYQLLPSPPYFSLQGSEYDYYLSNNSNKPNLPAGEMDFTDSMNYLSKTGNEHRDLFLNKNTLLHSQIDDIEIDNSYNISGCKVATLGKIKDLGKKMFSRNKYGLEYIDGDGTVPLRSADIFGENNYYIKEIKHSQIPGAEPVKEFVLAVLSDDLDNFDFSKYDNFRDDDSFCGISGYQPEFHCPADLHIYDSEGNHAGPDENGDIEVNIPGAQYDIIDGDKFAFLPIGGEYTVKGQATDSGALEMDVRKIDSGEYVQTTYFNNIPLISTGTNLELEILDIAQDQEIKLDKDGDGIFEETISPSSILEGDEMDDYAKPTTTIEIIGTQNNEGGYLSTVRIELTAQDDNSGLLKTEYSLDNGETWTSYEEPIIIIEDGEHKIIYSSTDRAGNREIEKEAIINIHILSDIDLAILNIERLYSEGKVNNQAKEALISRLNAIKEYQENYGERQLERSARQEEIMNNCIAENGEEFCEEKFGQIFDRIDYALDQIHKTILKARYSLLLSELKLYRLIRWVSSSAYDIIKIDIENLRSKI